jgi:two-component system, sensor histidine kinase and response regulator
MRHAPADWREASNAIVQSLNEFDFEQAVMQIDQLLETQTQGTPS